MAGEKKSEGQRSDAQGGSASASREQPKTGDPGRTPGTAEGDRETVEEDLKSKAARQNARRAEVKRDYSS